jgi:Zn-dependent peptidase ImmA (M78 family)/transcriptional regulator with XRE-family HTH domain
MDKPGIDSLSLRIAARLKRAREDLDLTLAEASRQMGFENYQVLIYIEKGERAVRAFELVNFARIYQRSLDYFLSVSEPAPRPAIAWRERGSDAAVKQVEQKFLAYCEDYARLETLAEGEPTRFRLESGGKVSSYDDAVALGEDLSSRLALGGHPARGLGTVLEERGVKIMLDDIGAAGSAAATRGDFGAGILINWRNAPWRINFDIAHELFHLLTWDQFPPPETPQPKEDKALADRFADAFASAFLLPGSEVVKEFRDRTRGKKLTYLDCASMAADFGVSRQALIWRLVNLRLVTKDSGTEAMDSETLRDIDRAFRRNDWKSPVDWPTPRFVAVAFKCLQLGRISRARFAQLMGIHRNRIDAFLAERGYNASEDYAGEISTA